MLVMMSFVAASQAHEALETPLPRYPSEGLSMMSTSPLGFSAVVLALLALVQRRRQPVIR